MATIVVNTHEAKSRLSELLRLVEEGQEVIVARNGAAVAKLVQWPPARRERRPGAWRGKISYAPSYDPVGSDPDVDALFADSIGRQ